jgi:hypothetical protein
MTYDFNTKRMDNKIQINVREWVQPSDNLVELRKINGRSVVTYISKALTVGKGITDIKKGDYALLSKVSCDVATTPTSPYVIDDEYYYDIPYSQVMGIFLSGDVTIDSLKMLNDKVLFKKVEKVNEHLIELKDSNMMMGEVLNVGNSSSVKRGDIILLANNVSTPVYMNGVTYYAAENQAIVGVFRDKKNLKIQNMRVINNSILMKPYIPENVLNSTILKTPDINYEDLDYSNIYNRNLFRVCYFDPSLKSIKYNDIVLLDRNYTNYVYFDNEKYFLINDIKWVSAKINERDN